MRIPRCKGASDVLPQDMKKFRRVKQVFRNSCEQWGYGEIRTPTLEYLHLFTSAGTLSPEMLGRVYSFLDWDGWSGERVVLRPDGTIPAARLFVQDMPGTSFARLYYIENMFSFEGTGQASRERWQCGVELLGSTAPAGDAELIMLALEVLQKLEIPEITLKISHVGLIKALLKELDLEKESREQRLADILTGEPGVVEKFKGHPAEITRFLKLLLDVEGRSQGFLENIRSILPKQLSALEPYIDDMAQVTELLDSIEQAYTIDFASGEGFEYYTGTVFQFYGSGELLGKGGRYDELIPLIGGGDVPASGFALLIDRIMALIQPIPQTSQRILLTRANRQATGMKALFEIAGKLREIGYIVEIDQDADNRRDYDKIVSLEEDGTLLTLTDQVTNRKKRGLSSYQLLKQLGASK